ncbi:MAG: ABC transporter ATP-binding protein [Clostridia bacterium]|nr:ABC transporter ATP-binding protein [Clostridia bacterium]
MLLEASHVCVSLGGKRIVEDISFSLMEGEWLMLIGPNGAGKSTLLSALSGTLPCEGEIRLTDLPLATMKSTERAKRMGLLLQKNSGDFDFTVEEVVRLGRYASRRSPFASPDAGTQRVEEALTLTGMQEMRHKRIRTLSGGEVQRAFLAQVLAQDPSVLLLDEPGNHLDYIYQKQLFTLIDRWRRQPGRAVLCVVHDVAIARRFADRILLMDHGKASALGTPEEVLQADRLRDVYSMDIHAWLHDLYAPWQTEDAAE